MLAYIDAIVSKPFYFLIIFYTARPDLQLGCSVAVCSSTLPPSHLYHQSFSNPLYVAIYYNIS